MHAFLLVFEFIGTGEMLLIAVIALVLFGPRKLPEIGRTIGKAMGEFRRVSDDFKRTWEYEVELEKNRPRVVGGAVFQEAAALPTYDAGAGGLVGPQPQAASPEPTVLPEPTALPEPTVARGAAEVEGDAWDMLMGRVRPRPADEDEDEDDGEEEINAS